MLSHLSIKNYILIKELELDFSRGFTAVTGETGAGKSILLGALSLILGKRADTGVLQDKDQKCVIEGGFNIVSYDLKTFFETNDLDYEPNTLLRREISKQGKSRAFINDTPVNLTLMRDLGEKLVDIHSQHEALLIGESSFQLALLDDFSGNAAHIKEYQNAFDVFQGLIEDLGALRLKEAKMRSQEQYMQFQYEELSAALLEDGELVSLEEELKVLNHAEEIKRNLNQAVIILHKSDDSLITQMGEANSLIGRIADYHKEIEELNKRLKSSQIELEDIGESLESIESDIVYDPGRMETVNERLDLIYSLLQKHKLNSVMELLALQKELSDSLLEMSSLEEEINNLEQKVKTSNELLGKQAERLRKQRKKSIPEMQREIENTLSSLGMENAKVHVSMSELNEFGTMGLDRVEYQFSANEGSELNSVSKIASGGELSRLMLAFKSLITRKKLLPTIILDEIDMGVSGEIAGRVGELLNDMSEKMQLIAITHLPQIAGKAKEHFNVYKKMEDGRTVSAVKCLTNEERIEEIASMLSNKEASSAAKETARELLGMREDN